MAFQSFRSISFFQLHQLTKRTMGWVIDGSHDEHHKSYSVNFGTLTIFDRIYGTYKDPNQIPEEITSEVTDK